MPLSPDTLKAVLIWVVVILLIGVESAAFSVSWMRSDFVELRAALGRKVDEETRHAMLADVNHRLERLDKAVEALEGRVGVLMDDRREGMARGRHGELDRRTAMAGLDGTNLSGHGSASAAAYSRKIRDRLRPVIASTMN